MGAVVECVTGECVRSEGVEEGTVGGTVLDAEVVA